MRTLEKGTAYCPLHLLPDDCLSLIASKLTDPLDLAALSLVSKTWLSLSNHAKESLDTRAFPGTLQDKLLKQMLARFMNLRALIWGNNRSVHTDLWLADAYSNGRTGKEDQLPVVDLVALVALKAPLLTSLHITSPSIILDPQSCRRLLSALPKLTSLSLSGASWSQLSQAKALAAAGASCPLLKTFSFRDYSLYSIFAIGSDLSEAEGLAAARQFADGCPQLRSLTLGWITPVALASTVELLRLCTGLEELHLEPRLFEDGIRLLLDSLARACPCLTSLGLDLDMEAEVAEALGGVIPRFNWPRLKVLRITSDSTEEMNALEMEEATWHAFQNRHPLMEECMIPGLMVWERFMADRIKSGCWEHLRKVNPGWLYSTHRTDLSSTLWALERNCPLLSEVTLHLDEGTDLDYDFRPGDASTKSTLPSVVSLHLSGDETDYRRVLRKLYLGACFPSLRHLDLDVDCTFKTRGRQRTSYFEGLGQLESLSFSPPRGKNVFGEISLHCPSLRKLTISTCHFRGSANYFVGDFVSLERLELHNVRLDVTNGRLIAKGCPRLRHLVIKRCSGSDGFKRLLVDCKTLRHVTINGYARPDEIKPSLQRLAQKGCLVVNRDTEDLLSKDVTQENNVL